MTSLSRRTFLSCAAGGAAFLATSSMLPAADAPAPTTRRASPIPFKWDRVPVYGHLGKSSDDFTPAEIKFLADHYDLITIEKGQAIRKRRQTEAGIYEAARQLKAVNPKIRVLFYWNSFIDYPMYAASEKLDPAWHLSDAEGKPVLKVGKTRYYDLSRADVREWWSDVAADAMKQAPLDGVFVDALPQVLSPARAKSLGESKAAALRDGTREMLRLTRQKIGADKYILANGIRAGEGLEILDWDLNAVMIEHFGAFGCETKEKLAADLDSIQTAAEKGVGVILKAWPGFTFTDATMMKRPAAELARLSAERITFPLACFLAGARDNCRLSYSWGYREDGGALQGYPELDKPLGPPKGPAQKHGWIWTRQFERATVEADLEKRVGRIEPT